LLKKNSLQVWYGRECQKNFFEELTSKLKLERMNRYQSGKKKQYSKQREQQQEQRFRAMKQYTAGRELVTVQNYLHIFQGKEIWERK